MATQGTEKHYRIIVLLSKCGGITTRRLLCKHIEDSSPSGHQPFPWTLDNFLFHKQQSILFFSNGKERYVLDKHKRLLFPTDGRLPATQTANIEEWDLLLLCNLLTDACDQSPTTKLDLKILKRIRNKICHTNDASLSDDKYDEYAENIEVILDRFLALIHDDDLTDEVHKQIKDVKDGALTRLESSIQILNEWHKNEKDVSKQLKRLEENSEVQLKDVREIKAQMQLMMTHFSIKKVPKTKLTMVIKNCNTEQEESVCRKLIAIVNPTLPPLGEETKDSIRSAMTKSMKILLSEDIELQTVEEECIAFYLLCPSVGRLLDVWMKCTSGEFTATFFPVEKCVRGLEGFENIQLQIILTEKEFVRCLNLIVSEIKPRGRSTNIQAALVDGADDFPGTAIELNITPSSLDQCKRILTNFESGSFTVDLQHVALACKEEYGIEGVTIDAQLEIEQSIRNIVVSLPTLTSVEARTLAKDIPTSAKIPSEHTDETISFTLPKVSILKRVFTLGRHNERSIGFRRSRLYKGLTNQYMAFFISSDQDELKTQNYVYNAFNDYFCKRLNVKGDTVCQSDRHFRIGSRINAEVHRCMDLSHVVILMLNKSFIRSHYCRYAANLALTENKLIVVVVTKNAIKSEQVDYFMKHVIEIGHFVRLKIKDDVYILSPSLNRVCDAIIAYVSKYQFDTTSTKPLKLK